MTYKEFAEKFRTLDCDPFSEVYVNLPNTGSFKITNIEIDEDGDLVLEAND